MYPFRELIIFWDVPSGMIDKKKPCRTGMLYRPSWLGEECWGTTLALENAPNRDFIAVGSEDGYLFIYNAETGMPRGEEKPATKHKAEVSMVPYKSGYPVNILFLYENIL